MGHTMRHAMGRRELGRWVRSCGVIAAALWALGLGGCTDETTVFVDKPLFEDPPAAAAGFLGYDEAESKLTVCGNCHVGQQGDWAGTAHADAWDGLQDSGHAQAFCEGCHTVGPNGNPTDGNVGWAATADGRYKDVQCESCHGPGQQHVANPDASQPLAPISVAANEGCAECHSGAHHPFVEEWAASGHAEPVQSVIDRASSNPAQYGYCLECHSGQGALAAWGVNAEYVEKDDPISDHVGFTCSVCHDPHDARNSGQLRFPIDIPAVSQNLCMKCHNRRAEPELTDATLRGPHAPQGPLLLGEAGWFPPGFEPPVEIVGTHGTVGNQRLCASCHVGSYDVTDSETGEFVVTVTGHRFLAIPCVDANGQPTEEQDCGVEDRQFAACAVSGCHTGGPAAARSAYLTARARIDELIDETRALIALLPEGEQDNSDGVFTTADGAWFNTQLAALDGTSTHNPFLAEQLLIASKRALIDQYDLPGNLIGSTEITLGR